MKRSFQYHLSREIRAIRMLHGVTPQFFPIVTLNAIVKAVLPYATVFLSAKILTELATLRRPNVLWKWVIVTILATALLSVLRSFFMEREETLLNDIYGRKELLFSEKAMSMDFADADRQEVRSLRAQIAQNEQWGGLGLINAAIIYKQLIGSLTGIFSGIALTVRLFATPVPESAGKLVLLSSPWFLLLLGGLFVGISLLSGRLYTVYAQENDRLSKDATFGNRVYTYITKLSRQKNIQMDMRVYRQQEMIDHLSSQNRVFTATGTFGRAALGKPGTCYSLATSMSAIAVGCIYVFTCLKAWAGAFDIGLVPVCWGRNGAGRISPHSDFLFGSYESQHHPSRQYLPLPGPAQRHVPGQPDHGKAGGPELSGGIQERLLQIPRKRNLGAAKRFHEVPNRQTSGHRRGKRQRQDHLY